MTLTLRALVIVVGLAISGRILACSVPQPGHYMETDELIREAETIVLVRLQSSGAIDGVWTKYTLETVEVIKGKADPSYHFMSLGSNESDNDFAGHTASEFWRKPVDAEPVGRSAWPCCICGPDHFFRKDREYLYFPDKLGAMKSAEVIRDPNDRWLQYVRSKVAEPSR